MTSKLTANLLLLALFGLACAEGPVQATTKGGSAGSAAMGGLAGSASLAGASAGETPSNGGAVVSVGGGGADGAGGLQASEGGTMNGAAGAAGEAPVHWVGTWGTAAQLTEPANLPPAPGLANRTLRQIFYVSVGGTQLRVHFSNAYGASALELAAVHLALSTSADAIDPATDRTLTFAGMPTVTMAPGATATSDVLDFALPPQTKLALSIALGAVPTEVTGHPGSRTTSYIVAGDATAAATLVAPVTTAHWYFATGIDVVADPASSAIVAFGDSITDGRGSTTDGNDRWPDALSRRLRQSQPSARIAVLNQGIGGNAVLAGGIGPTALVRFERDVLEQAGVRWVVLLHGVNDIGAATDPSIAQQLIAGYEQLVAAARSRGVRAYGVPILPFGGSMYDSPDHEAARQTVNAWIRAPGHFDAVIDLEAAVRDPAAITQLLAVYDDGDHLHPNASGYQKMADSIDLSLFLP